MTDERGEQMLISCTQSGKCHSPELTDSPATHCPLATQPQRPRSTSLTCNSSWLKAVTQLKASVIQNYRRGEALLTGLWLPEAWTFFTWPFFTTTVRWDTMDPAATGFCGTRLGPSFLPYKMLCFRLKCCSKKCIWHSLLKELLDRASRS